MTMASHVCRDHPPDYGALDDRELVDLVRRKDEGAVLTLVQRHNQPLYRIARAILRNDSDAEDVVQETYARAFTNLAGFRGESAFSTWLTRIAMNEAYGRFRRRRPTVHIESDTEYEFELGEIIAFPSLQQQPDPEAEAGRAEVRKTLQAAVDRLPSEFRLVFVLREVEGRSTDETAKLLDIRPKTVKTRLFRARRLIRTELSRVLSSEFSGIFPFGGGRCARLGELVVEHLRREWGVREGT